MTQVKIYMQIDEVSVVSFDNGESFVVCQENEAYITESLDEAMEMAQVIAFNNQYHLAAKWSE
jgi:hypothetical protein